MTQEPMRNEQKEKRKFYENEARKIIAEGYDLALDAKMNIDLVRAIATALNAKDERLARLEKIREAAEYAINFNYDRKDRRMFEVETDITFLTLVTALRQYKEGEANP